MDVMAGKMGLKVIRREVFVDKRSEVQVASEDTWRRLPGFQAP